MGRIQVSRNALSAPISLSIELARLCDHLLGGVLDPMNDDLETGLGQQFLVFGGIQTGIVERVPSIAANALPVSRPGIEHQDRQPTLVVRTQQMVP